MKWEKGRKPRTVINDNNCTSGVARPQKGALGYFLLFTPFSSGSRVICMPEFLDLDFYIYLTVWLQLHKPSRMTFCDTEDYQKELTIRVRDQGRLHELGITELDFEVLDTKI